MLKRPNAQFRRPAIISYLGVPGSWSPVVENIFYLVLYCLIYQYKCIGMHFEREITGKIQVSSSTTLSNAKSFFSPILRRLRRSSTIKDRQGCRLKFKRSKVGEECTRSQNLESVRFASFVGRIFNFF
jgi:hypothetical protein